MATASRALCVSLYFASSAVAQVEWTELVLPPAFGGPMVYDTARQRVVMLAGSTGTGVETWEWDGARWTRHPTPTQPPGGGVVAYDEARQRAVLFGGSPAGGGYLGPQRGGPDPGPDGFEVAAEGDLDGDGETSLFTRVGKLNPDTGEIEVFPLFIADEFE